MPPAWVEHALTPLQYYALEERSGTGANSLIYFITVLPEIPVILLILYPVSPSNANFLISNILSSDIGFPTFAVLPILYFALQLFEQKTFFCLELTFLVSL